MPSNNTVPHVGELTLNDLDDWTANPLTVNDLNYWPQISPTSDFSPKVISVTAGATNLSHLILLTSSDLQDCMSNKSLPPQVTHHK